MRLPPFWVPLLILGGIPSCGIEQTPPPEDVELELECPRCDALGIDTVFLHDESGERAIVLSDGGGSQVVKGASVADQEVWFSTRRGPMLVENLTRQDWEIKPRERLRLFPFDWGDSAFADTSVILPLLDPDPRSVTWTSYACAGDGEPRACGDYEYSWMTSHAVRPEPGSNLPPLRMPRLVARESSPLTVAHRFGYRGYSVEFTTLRPLPIVSWPPPLAATLPTLRSAIAWKLRTATGGEESVQLDRSDDRWIYHRVVFDSRKRLWEDSGSWDSSAGVARYVRKGPGLAVASGEVELRPRLVQNALGDSWWWSWEPALDSVAVRQSTSAAWVYFAVPR